MTLDRGPEPALSFAVAPPESEIAIDDIVVFRGRTFGFPEHHREIADTDFMAFGDRLWELVGEANTSEFHRIVSWEPFLVWVGPDVEAHLARALRFAQSLVGDPTLGVHGTLEPHLWAQGGIAYGRGRVLNHGFGTFDVMGRTLFGRGVANVALRASALGRAAPPGGIIIDDWAARRLEPTILDGVDLLPVTVARGKGGWLLPASTVRDLAIDKAA